jgi:hypothetical protein
LKEIELEIHDDDLIRFEAEGAAPLPVTNDQGYTENEGARIWYAGYGSGAPVILLHGGLGNSGNWGYQAQSFQMKQDLYEPSKACVHCGPTLLAPDVGGRYPSGDSATFSWFYLGGFCPPTSAPSWSSLTLLLPCS